MKVQTRREILAAIDACEVDEYWKQQARICLNDGFAVDIGPDWIMCTKARSSIQSPSWMDTQAVALRRHA